MATRKTIFRVVATAALIGIMSLGAQRDVVAQRPQADVRITRALDVSSDTLQVTVEYMYRGELSPGGVQLHATPEEEGGIFDPRLVQFDELPVRPGIFTHTLTITKRPDARDFTSVAVRVCLSTSDSALVCRDYPHRKQWSAAAPTSPPPIPNLPAPPSQPLPPPAIPAPQPAPQPVPQTCSLHGYVTGKVEVISRERPGGPSSRVRLRYIMAHGPNGTLRAEVFNGRYLFKSLPAGVSYRISPVGFSAKPHPDVQCRAGVRHVVNLQITGLLGDD